MSSIAPRFVLVTGSSGSIGRAVVEALLEAGHRVRGFDRVAHPDLAEQVVADLSDRAAIGHAAAGVDQVIHLAAHPRNAPFAEVLVPTNVVGLHHVVDAAVEAKAKRLILASTIQVIGVPPRDAQPVGVDYAAPANDYALTKLWAEQLGEMTARRHGIEVLAVRIGWLLRNADETEALRARPNQQPIYLSRSDAGRFFRLAVEAPRIDAPHGYACVYAVGNGAAESPMVDLEPARRLLGYEPRVSWPDEAPLG